MGEAVAAPLQRDDLDSLLTIDASDEPTAPTASSQQHDREILRTQSSKSQSSPDKSALSPATGSGHSPVGASNSLGVNGSQGKKASKEVSEYYKKQNDLLESFKNDSEQIQVFQRTRRRYQSETSDHAASDDVVVEAKSPLLVHNPKDETETVVDVEAAPSTKSVELGRKSSVASYSTIDDFSEKHLLNQKKAVARAKAASMLSLATLVINVCLIIAKIVASVLSGSLSILSSLVDSAVDITSGLAITLTTRAIRKRDPYLYPRGRTRLEPLALIIVSVVMGVASVQLIVQAVQQIANDNIHPNVDWSSAIIMVATIVVKFTLVLICQKYKDDPSIAVLAQDHRNDTLSNFVALLCAWLGTRFIKYFDPAGAILVSLYIAWTWFRTGKEHISMLSGKSASPEFINRIIKVCLDHDERIQAIDTVLVYHFGTRFLVEVHVVMDEHTLLRVAHDISEQLQINIESLPDVERAFVHCDYEFEHQPGDEHKVV